MTRVLLGFLALALTACSTTSHMAGSPATNGPATHLVAHVQPSGGDSPNAATVARAEQQLAISLLRQQGTGNAATSPFSLAVALAMLENGASGRTRSEIAKVLGTSGLGPAAQDAGWAHLVGDISNAAKNDKISLNSANALWTQRGLKLNPAFMTSLARYFSAGVWQVDFAKHPDAANNAINNWVKQQTNGKITKLFNPGDINPSTLLVLANAIYFKAAWQDQFDKSATVDGKFAGAGEVPFMNGGKAVGNSTGTYDAAQLAYKGGRFAAVAIMPKTQSLQAFLAGLDAEKLSTITGGLSQPYLVSMPRFTIRTSLDLGKMLPAMGMPIAFGSGADFSAMGRGGMSIQAAVQKDYLNVDENGSEAAAVTGIAVGMSAQAATKMTFDHPFLFLIRDTVTGTILFAARVQNPAG